MGGRIIWIITRSSMLDFKRAKFGLLVRSLVNKLDNLGQALILVVMLRWTQFGLNGLIHPFDEAISLWMIGRARYLLDFLSR